MFHLHCCTSKLVYLCIQRSAGWENVGSQLPAGKTAVLPVVHPPAGFLYVKPTYCEPSQMNFWMNIEVSSHIEIQYQHSLHICFNITLAHVQYLCYDDMLNAYITRLSQNNWHKFYNRQQPSFHKAVRNIYFWNFVKIFKNLFHVMAKILQLKRVAHVFQLVTNWLFK